MCDAEVLFGAPPASWAPLDPSRYARLGAYAVHAVPEAVVACPRWLAVLRTGLGFVCEGPNATTTTDPASAMPVRLYGVPAGVVVHVPCGQFDAPARSEYTFLDARMVYVASTFASAPVWPSAALAVS
jgi:hypothetical protein